MCVTAKNPTTSVVGVCQVYEERLYRFLRTFLKKDEIIRQYRADWLSNYKSIDFYIPKYKLGIEHQGSQHFYKTRFNGETEEKTSTPHK